MKAHVTSPRREQPEGGLAAPDDRTHRYMALQLEKESSGAQRHLLGAPTVRPGHRQRLGQVDWRRGRKTEQMPARARGVDRVIVVAQIVAHRVHRLRRHGQPVVFAGDELEPLGRLREKALGRRGEEQDPLAVQRRRQQSPFGFPTASCQSLKSPARYTAVFTGSMSG